MEWPFLMHWLEFPLPWYLMNVEKIWVYETVWKCVHLQDLELSSTSEDAKQKSILLLVHKALLRVSDLVLEECKKNVFGLRIRQMSIQKNFKAGNYSNKTFSLRREWKRSDREIKRRLIWVGCFGIHEWVVSQNLEWVSLEKRFGGKRGWFTYQ